MSSLKLKQVKRYLLANNYMYELKLSFESIDMIYELYINKKNPATNTKLSNNDLYWIMVYYIITNNRDMFTRYMLMFCGITDEKEIEKKLIESHNNVPKIDIRNIKYFPKSPLPTIKETE